MNFFFKKKLMAPRPGCQRVGRVVVTRAYEPLSKGCEASFLFFDQNMSFYDREEYQFKSAHISKKNMV